MKSSLAFLAFGSLATAVPLPIAIGTNTGGSGKSEGIYLSSFDPETGVIGEVKLGAKLESPGFLALHPSKPVLYSVGRAKTYSEEQDGIVASFAIGDGLELLGTESSFGKGPCHLDVDPSGKTLAVANYGDGWTTFLILDPDGTILKIGETKREEGEGPRKDRQDGPHAHGVYFRGNFAHVPDLGLDKILTYHVDLEKVKLMDDPPAPWASAPGAGPRHMAFSPDNRHAYVVNELDNTVTVGSYNAKNGTFETIHSVSTLPSDWSGKNTTAEIAVHPTGKFIYASNRGHDSIAVFSHDASTGKLERIQIAPCGGKIPRHFTIAPGGKWLLCAHQDSNTLAALPLDPATGKLGEPTATTACPNPICILFLPTKN